MADLKYIGLLNVCLWVQIFRVGLNDNDKIIAYKIVSMIPNPTRKKK